MKLLYFLSLIALFSACSNLDIAHKSQESLTQDKNKKQNVLDLDEIAQSPDIYTQNIKKKRFSSQIFLENYFKAWNIDRVTIDLKEAMWAHNVFKQGDSYGENLNLFNQSFFDEMLVNANFKEYATLNKKAVTLDFLDIRAFPTNRPLLKDPTKAGEGFPFDYMQNSTVAANKPIIVSHYSKNKEWVFIQTSFAFGWVKAKDIAYIPKRYIDEWKKAEQIILTKEGVDIYSQRGEFLFKSRIGMLLALISEDSESYTVLTVKGKKDGEARYESSKILKQYAHKGLLPFDTANIKQILSELLQSNYGWGGMYGQRDCSSTLRDFYTPFGLWLSRNSFAQSKQGTQISLENMSSEEKIETIKKNAVAFETLLYKQGHIVLYVGTFDDEIIVFQNVWGVTTKYGDQEGRYVIGRTLFSGLELGKSLQNYDKNSSLLVNLKSMSFPAKEN